MQISDLLKRIRDLSYDMRETEGGPGDKDRDPRERNRLDVRITLDLNSDGTWILGETEYAILVNGQVVEAAEEKWLLEKEKDPPLKLSGDPLGPGPLYGVPGIQNPPGKTSENEEEFSTDA